MVSLDSPTETRQPTGLAIFLIVAGVIGWLAAFALTIDKFTVLEHPAAQLTCNINPLVGCSKNLASWQGAVLGFPNPIIGVACWAAPIAVGVAILAGARFKKWFWMLFNLGVLGAIVLVIFLIYSSLYSLFVLCPYCMVTWVVTIPTFWVVTFYNLKEGNIPTNERVRSFFTAAYSWIPLITLISYVIVAVFAQIQVQWIPNAFR
jgi:uncharacterized membrane protein